MKQILKKISAAFLAVVMIMVMLPTIAVPIVAETVGGECGEDVLWSFNEGTGVLTISSLSDFGIMEDFYEFEVPWIEYYDYITSIVVGEGVARIGDYAFYGMPYLTDVKLSSGLEGIGRYAFSECMEIRSIVLPYGLMAINEGAFKYCLSLESIIYCGREDQWNIAVSLGRHWKYETPAELKFHNFSDGRCVECGAFENIEDCTHEGVKNERCPFCGLIIGECGANGDNLTWIIDPTNRTIVISGEGDMVDVVGADGVAPWNKFRGYYDTVTIENGVTSIGDGCFLGSYQLVNVTIPESVEKIGKSAFASCQYLTNINIPEGVESIGDFAFYYCNQLQNITLPSSVTSMGKQVFSNCENLRSITVTEGNEKYHSVNNCIIETASKTLIAGCGSSYIPHDGSVTSIGDYAFCGSSELQGVNIPSGVTSIGDYAFYGCYGVVSINIPSTVTHIGDGAFMWCEGLETVSIPSGITTISKEMFYGCLALPRITIPSGVTAIGDEAFYYCESIESLIIPSSVTSIGKAAFAICGNLKSITLYEGITTIGDNAFASCASLTSITIPQSVTSIGEAVFSSCTSLGSVTVKSGNTKYHSKNNCIIETATKTLIYGCKNSTIPYDGSVETIGIYAFAGCYDLLAITIPEGIISIEDSAFVGCSELSMIAVPSSVKRIGDQAFRDCSSASIITFFEGLESIGDSAFMGCENVRKIKIPKSVTSIGEGVFSGCYKLTEITVASGNTKYHATDNCLIDTVNKVLIAGCKNSIIPSDGSVTVIGTYVFAYNDSITSVTIPACVTEIGNGAFYSCYGLSSVTISKNSKLERIGDDAFGWCDGLWTIKLPGSLKSIGEYAFYGCDYLETILYCGVKGQWSGVTKGDAWKDETPSEIQFHNYENGVCTECGYVPLFGDVSGDGDITNADVLVIYRYIYNPETYDLDISAGDVNKDGIVTNADVLLIYRYIYDSETYPIE